MSGQISQNDSKITRIQTFTKQHGATMTLGVLALLFVIAVVSYRSVLFTRDRARTWLVLLTATAILVGAQRAIYEKGPGDSDPTYVRYTILFSSIIFSIVGFSTIIISCTQWGAPVLMAGGSLLIGGFLGLLFGYPSGVASQPVKRQTSRTTPVDRGAPAADQTNQNTPPKGQTGQQTPPADQTEQNAAPVDTTSTQSQAQDRNLLAEASSTLGKLLTGFTLAKADSIKLFASTLCHRIGPAFGPDDTTNFLMAGAMLAFFLSTGFVSGLLLPSYFMSGKFAN